MRGGWSGFGMVTVGIHPNDFDLNPNKIPPGVEVQNCLVDNSKRSGEEQKITKELARSYNDAL